MKSDTSHGWVVPRADGARAKCGGPNMCPTCQTDMMHKLMLDGLFGAPARTHAATGPDEPLARAAARLSAMAEEARKQYQSEIAAGGEPAWPAWVDDLTNLLQQTRILAEMEAR